MTASPKTPPGPGAVRLTPMPRTYTPLGMRAPRAASKLDAVALVVDGDAVSRRFAELALTGGPQAGGDGIAIETANDATSALGILQNTMVDLIISDSELPDMSGLELQRRLQRESRLGAIPMLFFSADAKVRTKVLALSAGAEDYLLKPCDPAELRARAQAILVRHRNAREAAVRRGYVLAGDFSAIPFPDLVGILGMGQRTGVLSVATKRAVGRVYFSTGQVVHAVFGNLAGHEAFYAILGEDSGKFEFLPTTSVAARGEITIHETLTELIMEGARLLDTKRAVRSGVGVSPDSVVEPIPVSIAWSGVLAGPSRAPHLAAHFAQAIRDPFALGEPYLFTADELARWTRASGGRDRLHVLLLADIKAGISALLPLASEPTERWVMGALSPEPKVMGLAFFLRQDRVLDVVLLDVRSAGAFHRELRRAPAILAIAPPEGDFLEISTRALVEIEGLVRQLGPGLVLGIGDAAVEQNLRAMSSIRAAGIDVRCVRGALGEGRIDLRAALVDAIHSWGSPGGGPAAPISSGFGSRTRA